MTPQERLEKTQQALNENKMLEKANEFVNKTINKIELVNLKREARDKNIDISECNDDIHCIKLKIENINSSNQKNIRRNR